MSRTSGPSLLRGLHGERLSSGKRSPSKRIAHNGIWVEPSVLAEIEYRAKSAEGKLRHPFFKGIREDL